MTMMISSMSSSLAFVGSWFWPDLGGVVVDSARGRVLVRLVTSTRAPVVRCAGAARGGLSLEGTKHGSTLVAARRQMAGGGFAMLALQLSVRSHADTHRDSERE